MSLQGAILSRALRQASNYPESLESNLKCSLVLEKRAYITTRLVCYLCKNVFQIQRLMFFQKINF